MSKCNPIVAGTDSIKWNIPNSGWIKINSDGAASRDDAWSMVGGVLRNSTGNWVEGYQRYVGRGSTMNVELGAILHGLELVRF